jgi:hypothetical protein
MTTEGEARFRRMQARMDAQAAERHNARVAAAQAAAKSAAPRVRPATEAEFKQMLAPLIEATARLKVTEVAPAATPVTEDAAEPPTKPLHEMNNVEFRAHAAEAWSHVAVAHQSPAWVQRPPLTISDYLANGGSR